MTRDEAIAKLDASLDEARTIGECTMRDAGATDEEVADAMQMQDEWLAETREQIIAEMFGAAPVPKAATH